jgi:hypothetical protein
VHLLFAVGVSSGAANTLPHCLTAASGSFFRIEGFWSGWPHPLVRELARAPMLANAANYEDF